MRSSKIFRAFSTDTLVETAHRRLWYFEQQRGLKSSATIRGFLKTEPYAAPPWASNLSLVPTKRTLLGLLPTPVHKWNVPDMPTGMEMWIKRDDMSGNVLSGNKVRKLEFLLADAKQQGCDCVITVGAIQSNHCRATAAAARYLGMDAHLILRNSAHEAEHDPGLVGNLMIERMVGAHVYQVTKQEYEVTGSGKLLSQMAETLRQKGHKPYAIPIGGGNALGTWGYLECVRELEQQLQSMEPFTDVVVACGSGTTTVGGLALGIALSKLPVTLHAYGICESPPYFYKEVTQMYKELGALPLLEGRSVEDMFIANDAKGAGYAMSRPEELDCIKKLSTQSGVILDPVYTGKAAFKFLEEVRQQPQRWKGKRVLFVHTGGLLGLFAKTAELQPLVESLKTSHRLQSVVSPLTAETDRVA